MPAHLPGFISRRVLRGRYAFIDMHPRPRRASLIACAGFEDCAPDYEIRRETFGYHAIEYIAGGEWELVAGGRKRTMRPGAIFAYGPDLAYSLRPLGGKGLRKYFIDFQGCSAPGLLARAGLKHGRPAMLSERRWLQDLLDQLIDAADLQLPLRRRIGDAIGRLIVERIRIDVRMTRPLARSRSTYERCRALLAAHYIDIMDLAEAARRGGVTSVHLCRLFRRFGSETPHVMLTRLKMNHAAERIARGGMAVRVAASEVGFDDPYHFSRVFKKVHGMPPSKFASCGAD